MFYNKNTQEQKSLWQLKKGLNASIPRNAEQIGDDWFLLHTGKYPAATETKKVVKGPIELIDGKYTQTYVLADKTAEDYALEEEQKKQQQEEELMFAKDNRRAELENLKVTYNGIEYDANEQSQNRMSRAISSCSPEKSIDWVDASDTVQTITIQDLKNILELAVDATTKLWVRLYTAE